MLPKALFFIFISFFEAVLIRLLGLPFGYYENLSLVLFVFNGLLLIYFVISEFEDQKIGSLVGAACLIYCSFVFIDLYGRDYFRIIHSGADSEAFWGHARRVAIGLSDINQTYLGIYPKMLALLSLWTIPARINFHFLNVILISFSIVTIYKCFLLFRIEKKLAERSILFIAFFPHSIIFSSILLREAFVVFFVVQSLYYFSCWFIGNKSMNIVYAMICVLIACLFHPGVFPFLIIYFMSFTFLREQTRQFELSFASILLSILIGGAILGTLIAFPDLFLDKFAFLGEEDENQIYDKLSYTEATAGSAYLSWINYNSPLDILIYSPLKIVYFLYSPFPWDWRGATDIVSTLLDASVYLYFTYNIWTKIKKLKFTPPIKVFVVLTLTAIGICIFLFAFGTIATGTAMRHRFKLFYAIAFISTIIQHYSSEKYLLSILRSLVQNKDK